MNIDLHGKFQALLTNYGRHALFLLVAVLLVHDIFGTHGFLVMHHKQQDIQIVKTELDRLNKENIVLEQDRQDLKTDPQTIERIAREELKESKPGEVIIRMPAPEPAPSTPLRP